MRADAAFFEAEIQFARWARKAKPRHTAKWLRAELKISKAKADRALAGDISKDTLARALKRWKWDLALVLLEPFCGRPAFEMQSARLARLEREVMEMRAESAGDADEVIQVAGGLDRSSDALAPYGLDGVAQRPDRPSRRAGEKTQNAPRKGHRS